VDINIAWETITENIKISAQVSLGYFELKQQKPWFDNGHLEIFNQNKQVDWNG
jgi:hypothetical protein